MFDGKWAEGFVNGTIVAGKGLIWVGSEVVSTIGTAINPTERIKIAESEHTTAFNEVAEVNDRCQASRKIKNEQYELGKVKLAIKEYEEPTITIGKAKKENEEPTNKLEKVKEENEVKTEKAPSDVKIKTRYWGDGWVPGAGFGFDLFPENTASYGDKIWVDINYANLVEAIDPMPSQYKTKDFNCIEIDDLVKKLGNYTIPAKYSEDGKPIKVTIDDQKQISISYVENSSVGGRRKKKTKSHRRKKNRKYSLKKNSTNSDKKQ